MVGLVRVETRSFVALYEGEE